MAADPGAVREQIAYRDISIGKRVGEVEERDMFTYGIIPRHLAVVNQHAYRQTGERLGATGEGKHGIGSDRIKPAEFLDTMALQINKALALDNRQRHSRNAPLLERV